MKNNNFLKHRKLFAFFVLLLIPAGVFAQTNFSGTWAFNESKSNFGESQFRFAATTMVVTQDDKVLTVETTRPGQDGNEVKMTAKYNLDGTVSENSGFNNTTRKSTVTWSADKASITIASTMTFDMNGETRTMNSSQTWKLTEGGKLLLLDNVMPGRDGGEMKTTVAYDKK
ncbi:MAG: hypothetical protein NTZ85_14825 [Bacteroidia bacterium]|nr:hypothetical protein [Bacteroidia bacterium]